MTVQQGVQFCEALVGADLVKSFGNLEAGELLF